MEKYLPIGSVVLLKESNKRLMIYGRKQVTSESDKVWDYIGCLFPEGNLDQKHMYVFDHEQIQQIYMVGFQDIEEIIFREKFLS